MEAAELRKKSPAELKAELAAEGHVFESQTDTEVIAHLIADHCKKRDGLFAAAQRAFLQSAPEHVAFVGEKLSKTATPPDERDRVKQLVADLDADAFAQASAEAKKINKLVDDLKKKFIAAGVGEYVGEFYTVTYKQSEAPKTL